MTRTTFVLYLSLFWCLNLSAQTKDSVSKPKIQFCSKNELGGLIGIGHLKDLSDYRIRNPEWALELISTNGIQYKSWFVGIGLGARAWGTDFTFPLFAHVLLDLWKSAFFLHADIGNQFGTRQKNYFGDKETGNFYAAYGLGYDFSVAKRMKLYLKTSICHQNARAFGPSTGLGPHKDLVPYDIRYLFVRVSLGLKFTN